MRHKLLIILAAVLVASAASAGTTMVRSHLPGAGPQVQVDVAGLQARLIQMYGAAAPSTNSYVGQEFCIACHKEAASIKHTRHYQMIRRPMAKWTLVPGKGVIAKQAGQTVDDFMAGLDLGTLSAFKVYGANAPKLSYEAATDGYFMTIGGVKCQLWFTLAGSEGQDQRFIVRIPVTDTATKWTASPYFAPIQYSPTKGWSAYSPTAWYDASTNAPRITAGMTSAQVVGLSKGPSNHAAGCSGCHTTGIRSMGKTAAGEVTYQGFYAVAAADDDPSTFDYDGDGNKELTNITCESCHGPGAQHILGGGDPAKIVNPATLTGQAAVEICGRCHIRGKSKPNGTFNWPYDDANGIDWIPRVKGQEVPLDNFNSKAALTYWPDGWLPSNPRPYDVYVLSAHYATKYGQNGSSEACGTCHDLHEETNNPAQIRESIYDARAKLTIPTSVDNNTFCLACHATHGPFAGFTKEQVAKYEENKVLIGTVTEAHTHHPYGPERAMGLSRCVDCHMSAAGNHTFDVIEPEKTLKYQDKGGMPNACAQSCHNQLVNIFGLGLDPASPDAWNKDFDKANATILKAYYGPDGLWWKKILK